MSKVQDEVRCIVFSYNRPAQIDLFLRSLKKFTDFKDVNVSYMHTKEYQKGYERVIKDNPDVNFVYRKKPLKYYVEKWLDSQYTAFFCDDDIFISRVRQDDDIFQRFIDDSSILCLSLRMGANVNYCFDMNEWVKVPSFLQNKWEWQDYPHDWGYPMSVSGHVYRSNEILEVLDFDYTTPTNMESQMSQRPINKPYMICYPEQKVVESPINIVQTECDTNRTGDVSVKWLNDEFMKGQEVDLDNVLKQEFNSPHQLIDIKWRNK